MLNQGEKGTLKSALYQYYASCVRMNENENMDDEDLTYIEADIVKICKETGIDNVVHEYQEGQADLRLDEAAARAENAYHNI